MHPQLLLVILALSSVGAWVSADLGRLGPCDTEPAPLCCRTGETTIWYTIRMEGRITFPGTARPVLTLLGGPSMEELLARLHRRLEEHVDDTLGMFPNGLLAALGVQLDLHQWTDWSAFRDCEKAVGHPYPTTASALKIARSSGSSSPGGQAPPAKPASPPT